MSTTAHDAIDEPQDEAVEYDEEALEAALRPTRAGGVLVTVLGALGLLAAFTLAVEKVETLLDPNYVPSCNFNPVLSCGSVMSTDQAALFGFPNPFLGILGFSVVVTVGVVLASGVRLPVWIHWGLALGCTAGLVFIHWLAWQSLYDIKALCPYCMVVWTVTIPLFVWSTLSAARMSSGSRLVHGLWSYRLVIVLAWYLVFIAAIGEAFWSYWSTLL
ncbi:vitamin K epoxide reductase family protein [Nocardioides bruguierae]|uniref:Vitamin K epoxide reductase family protein n=1 Tax=Nocardioides bruguierae TaxID=2945102 RepID=A0A9X2IEE5_9ACTN|nr:vitamin K epoxide reductase family protein [Nocardioides bruguierae]MCM0620212.1 vitamin K epoxide reductase family protein [Nocardioides bruguierae]